MWKTERLEQLVDHCEILRVSGENLLPGNSHNFYFMDDIYWCSSVFCEETSQLTIRLMNLKEKVKKI